MRDPRELRGAWTAHQEHEFWDPSPELAPYVERYWSAIWRYGAPYRQVLAPQPNVALTAHDGVVAVRGVASRHRIRVLEGEDRVFGIVFRAGSFRPWLGAPVASIRDRVVAAGGVFGPDAEGITDRGSAERVLRAMLPAPDPQAIEATAIVEAIAGRPDLARVDLVAATFGCTVRQLQRLFAEHVGISPKWLIRWYRLREVTERLAAGASIDWAGLAAELGYADQAHFVRDFRAMFGETPTHHAARY